MWRLWKISQLLSHLIQQGSEPLQKQDENVPNCCQKQRPIKSRSNQSQERWRQMHLKKREPGKRKQHYPTHQTEWLTGRCSHPLLFGKYHRKNNDHGIIRASSIQELTLQDKLPKQLSKFADSFSTNIWSSSASKKNLCFCNYFLRKFLRNVRMIQIVKNELLISTSFRMALFSIHAFNEYMLSISEHSESLVQEKTETQSFYMDEIHLNSHEGLLLNKNMIMSKLEAPSNVNRDEKNYFSETLENSILTSTLWDSNLTYIDTETLATTTLTTSKVFINIITKCYNSNSSRIYQAHHGISPMAILRLGGQ